MNIHRQEAAILQALLDVIRGLQHVEASSIKAHEAQISSNRRLDAAIELSIAGKNVLLLIELKKEVFPRDVAQIAWQLKRGKSMEHQLSTAAIVPMVAAASISKGAREILQQENIGFFDIGGSLFIPAPGAYLFIDRPVPKAVKRSVTSLFTGKRSQVLHALLLRPKDWVGSTELATMAQVSAGTASETLTTLEKMEWVDSEGQGPTKQRRLTAPSKLLDEWKDQIQSKRKDAKRWRYYIPGGGGSVALAQRFADLCAKNDIEYVLTQDLAAQKYAPYLTSIARATFRISSTSAISQVLQDLEARIVTDGANLDLFETATRSEFLFKQFRDNLWLASPIQVYLDLFRSEGRSRDMAEHLRNETLGI